MTKQEILEKLVKKTPSVYGVNVVTEEDFTKAFKNVLDLLIKIKQQQNDAVFKLEETYYNLLERIKKDYDSRLDELKDYSKKEHIELKSYFEKEHTELKFYFKKEHNKMYEEHEKMLAVIDKRLSEIKDGKDADEIKIVQDVLSQIKFPSIEETRNELESLSGENKLNTNAIWGLENLVKKLLEEMLKDFVPKRLKGGFGRLGGFGGPLKKITITGTINGVNNTLTLDKDYIVLMLYWNGQLQQDTTHYTKAGKTITFTAGNIPTDGTLHGFGQS